jgi:hypothetical protein
LFAGVMKEGVAGAGPRPVTVNVCTGDHAESTPPFGPSCVAFTLQKYVPLGKPLILSAVRVGIDGSDSMFVNPEAITVLNVELVPTCHV